MKEWLSEYTFKKGQKNNWKKKCVICGNKFLSNGPKTHCSWKCFLLLKRNIDENECWIWKGSLTVNGYGKTSNYKTVHRLSYETFIGEIPKGKFVLHKCDVRNCFNPDHLYIGTASDNMKDMTNRKRNKDITGEKHPGAKLSDKDILDIKERLKKGNTNRSLSKEYGVTEGWIYQIKVGKKRNK